MYNFPIENKDAVGQAFAVGRNPHEIVAYHGTSIHILYALLTTGTQSGSSHQIDHPEIHRCVRKGDIYVFPIGSRIHQKGFDGAYNSEDETFEEAKGYAHDISERHHLLRGLGVREIPSSSVDTVIDGIKLRIEEFMLLYTPRGRRSSQDERLLPVYDFMISRGMSPVEIDQLARESKAQKGIVLGYSKRAFDKGNPLPGDEGRDVRLQNLALDDILGIEPLDDFSFDFLDRLNT